MEKYEKLPRTKIWSAVAKWAFLVLKTPPRIFYGEDRLRTDPSIAPIPALW